MAEADATQCGDDVRGRELCAVRIFCDRRARDLRIEQSSYVVGFAAAELGAMYRSMAYADDHRTPAQQPADHQLGASRLSAAQGTSAETGGVGQPWFGGRGDMVPARDSEDY